MPTKITIEIIDILGSGKCSMGQEIGTIYNYPEDRGKLCPSSFYILYPWLLVLQSGGKFSFMEEDRITLGCADYLHQVVYKIRREETEE